MHSQAKQYLDIIADSLVNNHAAVMIGAGFSRNAIKKNPSSNVKGFSLWNDLVKICLKKLNPDYEKDGFYIGNPLSVFQ